MPGFEPWDIVKVPFPYANRPVMQFRPALVVALPQTGDGPLLLWVLMITSAENRGWTGDVPIPAGRDTGLPAPSVVRTAKIATIDQSAAIRLGALSDSNARRQVHEAVTGALAGL